MRGGFPRSHRIAYREFSAVARIFAALARRVHSHALRVTPFDDLVLLLGQHVSPINARVIGDRARRVLRDPVRINLGDRQKLLAAVQASAQLFLDGPELPALIGAVQQLLEPHEAMPALRNVPVRAEGDVRVARLVARDVCVRMGASSLVVQRVATVVSELARNIALYTPGGFVELETMGKLDPPRVRIVAEDTGTGIMHLEHVLSGNYRSKTGLGRGLLGVKQLMESFEIRTGVGGTRITAEASLR